MKRVTTLHYARPRTDDRRRLVRRPASAAKPAAVGIALGLALLVCRSEFGPNGSGHRPRSEFVRRTEQKIAGTLERYVRDVGQYPTPGEGLSALVVPPPGAVGWRGPYVGGDGGPTRDAWGLPFVYRTAVGPDGRTTCEVRSLGPDMAADTADDIVTHTAPW